MPKSSSLIHLRTSPLFRRYLIATSLIVTSLLIVFGALDAWLAFRDNVNAVSRRQQIEARAAAREIQITLAIIEQQIGQVAKLPWESGLLTAEDQREEFHRLQRLLPAILQIRAVDASRREQVFVSQLDADRLRSGIDLTKDTAFVQLGEGTVSYGAVYYLNQSEPFVPIAIREAPDSGHITVADIDLRHIARLAGTMRVGESGRAFLVDAQNRIIAHPSLSKTLGRMDVGDAPQIKAIRDALRTGDGGPVSVSVKNSDGDEVRTTGIGIGRPDWLLVVEEPLAEAMVPVKHALLRTLILLVIGLIAAVAISLWLAHRLTQPILQIKDGAVRIGRGDLGARIEPSTGDELGVVAVEFNRMAARLQESYAGLEAKVATRTRELALAKDEADRANAAKTRFLASASHDLRQPMHTISLLVGMLKEEAKGRRIEQVVGKIEASIDAMENLFGSLLDISKLDAGVIKPNVGDVELNALLRNLVVQYAPQATAKGLSLRIVGTSAIVRSDAALLARILGNLVNNAINYTNQGRIVVGCRRHGDKLGILIYDTGIGIDSAHLSEVFDEFVQLDNPGRDRGKGLGLGLSIVKRTADLLGHRLIVRSTPGRGSLFGVEVPFAEYRSGRAIGQEVAEASDLTLAGSFVAVIDDDQENRLAMDALCRQWGCTVASAASHEEILSELSHHLRAPDLVITDYRLRDAETGLMIIADIRRQAEDDVPAIVVTGDVGASSDPGFRMPKVVLLHKPLNPAQLRRAAEALLSRG